ncbi:RtcB family protein [Porphyrobacter sp. TH134]|uniref:RtcB family protein n=1 Tax=Porphyrobacter sp. TH134 TaxID=2067450 RepID=UPI0026AA50D8|nr:RtcB family protein [Porphyrobacter sp. TH134]
MSPYGSCELSFNKWAQDFAKLNRQVMMAHVIDALRSQIAKPFEAECEAVNCHHNYVTREHHFGENVLVTRKGAVHAAKGVMGIIPGSMGAKSFIVRGLGNPESFDSCSHGAGRVMSRTAAKKLVTLDEHLADTAGVECRKDAGVIDETPKAYKPIEAVMAAQADLVEIVHTLKQVVCVKG